MGKKTQFLKEVLLCIPAWPEIHYIPQDGFDCRTSMPSENHHSWWNLEGNISRSLLTNATCKPPLILTMAYSVIYKVR